MKVDRVHRAAMDSHWGGIMIIIRQLKIEIGTTESSLMVYIQVKLRDSHCALCVKKTFT